MKIPTRQQVSEAAAVLARWQHARGARRARGQTSEIRGQHEPDLFERAEMMAARRIKQRTKS